MIQGLFYPMKSLCPLKHNGCRFILCLPELRIYLKAYILWEKNTMMPWKILEVFVTV
jgi:hypothetical protein